MGDVTEMILDGLLCSSCGVVIDGQATGYPRECSSPCSFGAATQKKVPCPTCGKRISLLGVADHMKDVHKEKV